MDIIMQKLKYLLFIIINYIINYITNNRIKAHYINYVYTVDPMLWKYDFR